MALSIHVNDVVIGVTSETCKAIQTAARYFIKGMDPGFMFYWEQDAHACFTLVEFPAESLQQADFGRYFGATFWDLEDGWRDYESDWQRYCELFGARMPIHDFVICRLAPDNELHYYSITGQAVYDQQGCFTGYCGVVSDVTHRWRR
ncbi:MAG TPA: hypothetical protein VMH83_15650 [Candidatus Acidoferrum sp.]|nr:hypothetical protein [Candidatus Acidoferrum sp.]